MKHPNIVFILADQHRWDFMGGETNGVTFTPNLDALAARGARFRRTYCTAPLCCPSRQALHSGRYGMNTGCFTNLHQLPPGTPSFVSQLRAAGYRTAAIGKTHLEIHAYGSDLTGATHRKFMDSLGFDEVTEVSGNGMMRTGIRCAYSEWLKEQGRFAEVIRFYDHWGYFLDKQPGAPNFSAQEWPLPEVYQETSFVGRTAVEWVQRQPGTQPWFLHVGFTGPHSPIEPLPRFMDLYRRHPETPPWNWDDPPEWLRDGRRGYRAMISQMDEWVGRLVEAVSARGELDHTLFVYTADHGELAGDHGTFQKTRFYEGAARVPLVLAGPGVPSGLDSQALVELIDLGKTLCDLAGVPAHAGDQGHSLAPLLAGETEAHRATVYAEMGCDRMLFDGRWKLMWGDPFSDTRKLGRLHLDKPVNIPPSPPRLYDLAADPHELHDLAADSAGREAFHELQQKLLIRFVENVQPQPNKSRGEYRPVQV